MMHVSGHDSNMQSFMEMDLSVRPRAIAWMARNEDVHQISTAVPSLLEHVKEKFDDDDC